MAKEIRKSRIRKAGWTVFGLMTAVAAVLAVELLVPPKVPQGYIFQGKSISGMTRPEAEKLFRDWWSNESARTITFESHLLSAPAPPITLGQAGVEADIESMLGEIPFRGFFRMLFASSGGTVEIKPEYKPGRSELDELAQFVEENGLEERPARAYYKDGKIIREYEVPSFEFDPEAVPGAVIAALRNGKSVVELPVRMTKPHISKEALNEIVEVVSSFTTRFDTGKRNRSSNIATAASRINGVVLLPGETFSYNKTVGKRSAKTGFKPAPVYASGRHEVDYGGGICQASTTLFNAALLANLQIVERTNHSMPVPYVPIGRDATVDYGKIDLKIRNNYDFPIAISMEVAGGSLTARILGRKPKNQEVRIVVTDYASWGTSVKYINDPSLEPGEEVIEEKGSMGRRCTTWRVVLKDGHEVQKEKIGTSIYRAWPRIVRRNPRQPEITPTQDEATGEAAKPSTTSSAQSSRDNGRG